MRVLAILADARVEMERVQPWRRASSSQPLEQGVGEATAAVALGGDEVVDVEVVAPGEHSLMRKPATAAASSAPSSNAPASR